jgi:ATP-dependent Clp protease ATP-binding subunit ClpA
VDITIPIYVESRRPARGAVVYTARPLFFCTPLLRGDKLDRLLTRLSHELGQRLADLGRAARHDELARYTFNPAIRQQRHNILLQLRRRTARCRFLFTIFRQFDRSIAFTPSVPDLWFDLARGEDLKDRATEVLTRHFRELERTDEAVDPEAAAVTGSAQVVPLELTIRPPAIPPAPAIERFLLLGNAAPLDGAAELRRVGRCLDWQYPDELDRVHCRDREAAELTRLLDAGERRPVLVVGPRQVGKTALIHEYVFRTVRLRASPFLDRRNAWLIAPARLISGMSYVGQWENRVLAILKEASKREHLLYFDDLLGLFFAGQASGSSLSVADVLKPYLERRDVRVVAEITPEALRVLRERDRGFADLFHLLPLAEPSEAETLRILIAVQRGLEGQHRCRFALEVLPLVLDLQRRYGRDAAFPGKAAGFLRRLAVKFRGADIARADALDEFHRVSGLAVTFLDHQQRLERKKVRDWLAERVIGQEGAISAAADVIAIAKARLNDPCRPLAAFLFLGPTGVGKTECAKTIAAFLFGDPERLLRFDLNEYGGAGAAARLVGTFDQPEGLLVAAIRRQPFAVILLDEVEKAHPEVFDVLLQVLGEGRLTDSLGRTANFSNALIILTSNLGVRESEGRAGFRSDEAEADARFLRAAERFFRPEFFNRLDRVLPFRRLSRQHTRTIARQLIADVFAREGLRQRKCFLSVEDAALERIVDMGYDPTLGARALRRSIDRHLTQPVARSLARLPIGEFTAARIYAGPGQLTVHVHTLDSVVAIDGRLPGLTDGPALLHRAGLVLRQIEEMIAVLRPADAVSLGSVDSALYRYFAIREQIEPLRDQLRELEEEVDARRPSAAAFLSYRRPDSPRGYRVVRGEGRQPRGLLRELAAALDIPEYLQDLVDRAVSVTATPLEDRLLRLMRGLALVQAMAECALTPTVERVLFWTRTLSPGSSPTAEALRSWLLAALDKVGLAVTGYRLGEGTEQQLVGLVEGVHALRLTQVEKGTHLFCPPHAALELVQLDVVPVEAAAEPRDVIAAELARRVQWLDKLAHGEGQPGDDPFSLGPVVRIYSARAGVVDLRTGINLPYGSDLSPCLLATLPLPAELGGAR